MGNTVRARRGRGFSRVRTPRRDHSISREFKGRQLSRRKVPTQPCRFLHRKHLIPPPPSPRRDLGPQQTRERVFCPSDNRAESRTCRPACADSSPAPCIGLGECPSSRGSAPCSKHPAVTGARSRPKRAPRNGSPCRNAHSETEKTPGPRSGPRVSPGIRLLIRATVPRQSHEPQPARENVIPRPRAFSVR